MKALRRIALLGLVTAAVGCQRNRGPASPEAKELMRDPPPMAAEDQPAPPAEGVDPALTEPPPPQTRAEAPAPAPTARVTPTTPTTPDPATPAPPTPPPPAPTPTTTAATATAPTTTGPATRTGTTLAVRGTRVHVAADADDATRLRNWPVSVANYASGNTVAGPVYRFVPAPPKTDKWWDAVLLHESAATALTVPQFVATPIWMLFTSPFKKVEYHGEEVPPSYTADERVPYYQNEKVPGIVVIGK